MKKACFCGTFDPVTQGHLDLIQRATRVFDEVVVVIGVNSDKHTMFPLDQRKQWLEEALKDLPHVRVQAHAGLATEICKEIKADIFTKGEVVDVTGVSKGKGFQGVIKRHNQSRGPMGHGSQYHRGVGSLGTMLPMHVLKGKKLPGHMGHETTTIQNLEIVDVDLENNVILVKGNVPGPKKSLVMIKTSVKKGEKVNDSEELITYDDPTTQEQEAEIEAQDAVDEVETEETEVNE